MARRRKPLYAEVERKLEERTRELSEALEQPAATSEILRIISQSPTDVQPVFDAIVASANRLCDRLFSILYRFDGEMLDVGADIHLAPERSNLLRSLYPAPGTNLLRSGSRTLHRPAVPMRQCQRRAFSIEASPPDGELHAFTVGGVSKAGLNVFAGQIRKVRKNLLRRHSGREVFEHIVGGDSQPSNTRLATALSGLNRDDVTVVHGVASPSKMRSIHRHYTHRMDSQSRGS